MEMIKKPDRLSEFDGSFSSFLDENLDEIINDICAREIDDGNDDLIGEVQGKLLINRDVLESAIAEKLVDSRMEDKLLQIEYYKSKRQVVDGYV